MATWPEARAEKTERQRREARFYTPDRLGPTCPVCATKVPLTLVEAGIVSHPSCASSEFGNTPHGVGEYAR